MSHSIEISRRVWDDKEGVCILVAPSGDGINALEVMTDDAKSKEWWGDFRFTLDKGMAKALGEALVAASAELE